MNVPSGLRVTSAGLSAVGILTSELVVSATTGVSSGLLEVATYAVVAALLASLVVPFVNGGRVKKALIGAAVCWVAVLGTNIAFSSPFIGGVFFPTLGSLITVSSVFALAYVPIPALLWLALSYRTPATTPISG